MAQQGATKVANTIYNAIIPLMENSVNTDVRSVKKNQNMITISPNPVKGNQQMNINLQNFVFPAMVKLLNINGSTIYLNNKVEGENLIISSSNLKKGIYLLNISDVKSSISKKFIVN